MCTFFACIHPEVQVEFSEPLYSVSEDGSAAEILVCVEIVAGTVDPDGLTVTVENEDGGTATRKLVGLVGVVPLPDSHHIFFWFIGETYFL